MQPVAFNNRTLNGDFSVWKPTHFNASQVPPNNSSLSLTNILLNHTEIENSITEVPGVAGVTPRWVLYGKVENTENTDKWIESLIYVGDSKK